MKKVHVPQETFRLLLVSLEPARPSTAAEVHLRAIAEAFGAANWRVQTVWRQEQHRLKGLPNFFRRLFAGLPTADVVYARWHPFDLATPLLCLLFKRPLVWEVNGLVDDVLRHRQFLGHFGGAIRAVARRTFIACDLAISVSQGLQDALPPLPSGARLAVIPSGAFPRFSETDGPTTASYRRPFVLYFGELASRQGVQYVLDARHSKEWPPEMQLVVVGDGQLRGLVETHAAHNCLDYKGKVDREALHPMVRQASATLSLQDPDLARNHVMGRPLKIAESLIEGTPVIASPLSDIPQLFQAFPTLSELLVNPKDPDAVARAVAAASKMDVGTRHHIREIAEGAISWDRAGADTVAEVAQLLSAWREGGAEARRMRRRTAARQHRREAQFDGESHARDTD